MGTKLFYFVTVSIFIFCGSALADPSTAFKARRELNTDYQFSGPHAYKNLSIFLIHVKSDAPSKLKGKAFIPLAAAIKKGVVTVYETGQVNQLAATNHSKETFILIQSGDIVKGGRQDRTISQDVVLAPGSKNVVLDAFCVEQGRWSKRGEEKSDRFSSSEKRLSSKSLRLAAKKSKSQDAVWKAVDAEQEQLAQSMGKSVRKEASKTSLQLTLEDADLEHSSLAYQKALLSIGQEQRDVVGVAYAVNGKFNTADIYGSPELFQMLWPKLLATAANEAVARFDGKQTPIPATAGEIKRHILDGFKSPKKRELSTNQIKRTSGETKENHAFETKDDRDQLVHFNIIKK